MHRRRYEYGHEVLARAALALSLVFLSAMVLSWLAGSLPPGAEVAPQVHMGAAVPAPPTR
ncbi:MAG: hypothetical protein K0R27_3036 [Xanthobacteraceae bacterium]|nr:hypothetical protein [Xanthobacteraceae bacterium]